MHVTVMYVTCLYHMHIALSFSYSHACNMHITCILYARYDEHMQLLVTPCMLRHNILYRAVGKVRGEKFRRLLECLLRNTYNKGCRSSFGLVENVQVRAVSIIMGVGRLHPLASLQFEMKLLREKCEAMKQGIEF